MFSKSHRNTFRKDQTVGCVKIPPHAIGVANGSSPAVSLQGGMLIGRVRPNGACSFAATVSVPQVPDSAYSVSVLSVDGPDGSATLYGSFVMHVVGESSA